MANCMREVDEKQEISLLWPYNVEKITRGKFKSPHYNREGW